MKSVERSKRGSRKRVELLERGGVGETLRGSWGSLEWLLGLEDALSVVCLAGGAEIDCITHVQQSQNLTTSSLRFIYIHTILVSATSWILTLLCDEQSTTLFVVERNCGRKFLCFVARAAKLVPKELQTGKRTIQSARYSPSSFTPYIYSRQDN